MKHINAKLWHFITVTVLTMATITLLVYAYMVIFPLTPILEVKSSIITTKQVKAGGFVELITDTCKNHRYPSTLTRRFTNSIIVQLPEVQANQPMGCNRETFNLKIPEELKPGTYFFSAQFTYNVNQFNTKVYDMRTNTFEVTR